MLNLLERGGAFSLPCLLSFIHVFRRIFSNPLIICFLDWIKSLFCLNSAVFFKNLNILPAKFPFACPFLPVRQYTPLALRQLFCSSSFCRNPRVFFCFRQEMLMTWKLLIQPLSFSRSCTHSLKIKSNPPFRHCM